MLAVVVLLIGCRAPGPTPAPAASVSAQPEPPAGTVVPSDVPMSAFAPEPGTALYQLPTPPSRGGPFAGIYRQAAPATVIVRTPDAFGTGVVVDPDGLILTANHVVEPAPLEDFVRTVSVELGTLGDDGSLTRSGETLRGRVLARDRSRDLALVRVQPNAPLPSVPLADVPAGPGAAVATIGHAAIGLLWSMKECDVSAVSRLETGLAETLRYECHTEGSLACEPGFAESVGAAPELLAVNSGKVLQTTCRVAHGDSGGPLLDEQGALVGVNAFINWSRESEAPVAASFHVHLDEIREFLASAPAEPPTDLPDPWRAGPWVVPMDVDGDGRRDLLEVRGPLASSMFFDLDQDSPDGSEAELVDQRAFDAEVTVHAAPRSGTLVWYDVDADGGTDFLGVVPDDVERFGCPVLRIGQDGSIGSPLPDLEGCPLFRPSLFGDGDLGTRWTAMLERLGWDHGIAGRGPVPTLEMEGAGAIDADFDGDGRAESTVLQIGEGHFVVASDDPSVRVAASRAERWFVYDEVALYTADARSLPVATEAFTRDGATWRPAPEWVGRNVLQPDLVDRPLGPLAAMVLPAEALAADLPSPTPSDGRQPRDLGEVLVATSVDAAGWSRLEVDLDLDSALPQLDVELAIVEAPGGVWAWYDLDDTPGFDLVAFARDAAAIRTAWAVGDELDHRPDLTGTPLVRPSLFSGERRERAASAFPTLFRADAVESTPGEER